MKTGKRVPDWFLPLLEDAKKQAKSRAALAEALGVTPKAVENWEKGAAPGLDHVLALFQYMKGDLKRALPGNEGPSEAIQVHGQVAAGHATLAGEFSYEIEDGAAAIWRHSPFWKLTHGALIHLEVVGDSMEPEYENKEIIVCRAPIEPKNLPDGTPAIFRIDGDTTFKILRWAAGGIPIGEPINPAYDYIPFNPKRLEITHVVLGRFDIGNTIPRPRSGR